MRITAFLAGVIALVAACATQTPAADEGGDRALWEEAYGGYAWSEDYAAFRALVLAGDDKAAAKAGDKFIDKAALDLNYHNPDFGRLARELGAAHRRAGNLDRAVALMGQAHAALLYYDSYAAAETADVTADLADLALAQGRAEDAAALYEQAIAMAVVGGHDGMLPGFVLGLQEAYEAQDPRIGEAIEKARAAATPD